MLTTYPVDNKNGFNKLLLAISLMENEATQDTLEYLDFLDFVLDLFGKDRNNVLALIGENRNTNESMSRFLRVRFCSVVQLPL